MRLVSVLLIVAIAAASLAVLISQDLLNRGENTSSRYPSLDNVTSTPKEGIYIVNSTVYLVFWGKFVEIRFDNETFMHGGPLMAGFDGIYLIENSTSLNFGEVSIYNGTWYDISLPVFHRAPGGIPRSFLYPEGSLIPL